MTKISDGIIGLAVADALGVPVEFQSRAVLEQNPVVNMRAYGTYNQPKGTWSDDSSLTFCLADSLCDGYDLKSMARKFIAWKNAEIWTPHGAVFDIGNTTSRSIRVLDKIFKTNDLERFEYLKYEADEYSNGNGSLMRIFPLYFYLKGKSIETQFNVIWDVSALTHGHIRSAIACLIYLVLIDEIVKGQNPKEAYKTTQKRIKSFYKTQDLSTHEQAIFSRVIEQNIALEKRANIKSDGYVIHSLEAAIWCFLNQDSYESTVLTAVNLGEDTDTTAAIVGGLAGLYYGKKAIPTDWISSLVQLNKIEQLCDRVEKKYQ